MRVCAVAFVLCVAPAFAESPARIDVAPAGACAGEERDLALAPLAKPGDGDSEATLPGTLHLAPAGVAAPGTIGSGPAPAHLPAPTVASFTGPGACDNPGSGCALDKIVDDPDPGSGCGFPGSACP